MGEMVQSIGPTVAQVLVQDVDTQVNNIEITVDKPGNSWLCIGRIRWEPVVADPHQSIMVMFAVNGVVNEFSRVHRRDDWGAAGSFRTSETGFILQGLVPGDTIRLFGQQSVDDLLEIGPGTAILQVIAFGPEFRRQGFLRDTG